MDTERIKAMVLTEMDKMRETTPTPLVHINGSGQKLLLEQLLAVKEAFRLLQVAMEGIAPHGRDYPDGWRYTYRQARDQWLEWRSELLAIEAEIAGMTKNIDEQGKKKNG